MIRALIVLLASGLPSAALTIAYDVETPRPTNHLYHVTVELGDLKGAHVDLAMPAWTPGYYKIQNHAKNVRRFEARGADGAALAWEMVDKQTWRVRTGGAATIAVSYRVYAHQMSATGSDLTDQYAYFHGSWLFMYVPGAIGTPCTLRLRPPPGWKVATGLDPGAGENVFTAPDYDVLIDTPVLMGDIDIRAFKARDVQHVVAVSGEPRCDRTAMMRDIEKIVNAQLDIFGTPPYRRYVFLLHFPRWGGGGLEHLNSTSIVMNGEEMGDRNRYLRFQFVVSHEFFHTWNVKRIRPAQLGPFDYTKEVLTKTLWAHEGLTNYYGWLAMRRAGVIDRKEYLSFVQEELNNLMRRDGRRITSPEASSWRTWYDSDDPENVEVSYYWQGHLIGFVLDVEIRRRTGGAKSLDDVMRLAFEKTKGGGYPNDDFLAIVNEAAGGDYSEFFRKHVSGTEDLPYAETLPAAGVSYEAKVEAVEPWAGFDANGIGEDLVRISRVRDESPAGEAGFDEGDILLSAEGRRLRAGTFWGWLNGKTPGEKVTFVLFRGERLLEKTVTLGKRDRVTHLLKLVEKPTEEQRKMLDAWLR
jgi:predicted metalloprotease with PDZ domain